MTPSLAFDVAVLLVALVTAGMWWRGANRRRSRPCPASLSWLLEGAVMNSLLGTDTTLNRIGFRPGQRVLEVGPGPGRLLIPAARRVLPNGEVVGLDIQPGMIERLRTRALRAGVSNLTPVLGDVTKVDLPPSSFDVVYLSAVLGEIPDRSAALQPCYAWLKPGGLLSITEVALDPDYQSRSTVRRLAEDAGFRLRELQGSWLLFTANFVKP